MGSELNPPPPKPGNELKDALFLLGLARWEATRAKLFFLAGLWFFLGGALCLLLAVLKGCA